MFLGLLGQDMTLSPEYEDVLVLLLGNQGYQGPAHEVMSREVATESNVQDGFVGEIEVKTKIPKKLRD